MSAAERHGAATEGMATGHGEEEHDHPGWKFYVMIGVILTVITAVEVAIYYIDAVQHIAWQLLVPLSTLKFVLVVLFYMHLKMDHRLFSFVFLAPMVLAVLVVISMVLLFTVLAYNPAP